MPRSLPQDPLSRPHRSESTGNQLFNLVGDETPFRTDRESHGAVDIARTNVGRIRMSNKRKRSLNDRGSSSSTNGLNSGRNRASGGTVSRACSKPSTSWSLTPDSTRKGLCQKLFSTREQLRRTIRFTPRELTDRGARQSTLGRGSRGRASREAHGGVRPKPDLHLQTGRLSRATVPDPIFPFRTPTQSSSPTEAR